MTCAMLIDGHVPSSKVTNIFWAITFDWDNIQVPGQIHCVCHAETNQMIYSMTFSGQVMTLT